MNEHYEVLKKELEDYYSSYDPERETLWDEWCERWESLPKASSYENKSSLHEFLCGRCRVKLFSHLPFFFEMASGRKRFSWGGLQSNVATFFQRQHASRWLTPYADALSEDRKEGFFHGWDNPVGFDHHCAGYRRLLSLGLEGIVAEAEEGLRQAREEKTAGFYRSVIRSNRALMGLALRFSEEAKRLAKEASTEKERAHYEAIAQRSVRVPARPAESFLEALCAIVFYRECMGTVEGIGVSTFGLLDRLLIPYYRADLAAGRLTREQAGEWIGDLLIYTDIRFDVANSYHETSTTVELGGLDEAGEPVYNELTELILERVAELHSVSTKINCRISKKHPQAYLEQIACIQLMPLPCVMMHNDEVLIPAREGLGQERRDACWYLGCGCHEVVLSDTEVCTRADSWINLPRILLQTLRDRWESEDFEALYGGFLDDAKAYVEKIVRLKNEGERQWTERDPLPLYSSGLMGPLAAGKDVTEGGAKYNSTALSLLGIATLVDSLYTVRRLVFEEKALSLPELLSLLESDFQSDPAMHHRILQLPKHGTGHEELNAFSARVLEDLSRLAGQENARGGRYLPAVYPHDVYRPLGLKTGATPDGRQANTPLSRGVSPSEFIKTESPLNIIHSLKKLDFTRFGESFITEITLPALEDTPEHRGVLTAVIRAFLEAEGSSLQFNLLNKQRLLEAEAHPDRHKDLLVRVCGYSAPFVALSEESRREILHRAIR